MYDLAVRCYGRRAWLDLDGTGGPLARQMRREQTTLWETVSVDGAGWLRIDLVWPLSLVPTSVRQALVPPLPEDAVPLHLSGRDLGYGELAGHLFTSPDHSVVYVDRYHVRHGLPAAVDSTIPVTLVAYRQAASVYLSSTTAELRRSRACVRSGSECVRIR